MTGMFWDPFAPNESLQPVRFPVVERAEEAVPPPAEEGGEAVANEAPEPPPAAPWSPMGEPTPMERYMLFGEPYDLPELEPAPAPEPESNPNREPPPWSAMDDPTPVERYMLFGEPYDPPQTELAPEEAAGVAEVPGEPSGSAIEDLSAPPAQIDDVPPEAAGAPDMAWVPPVLGWPLEPPPVSAPVPDAPIFLPGEKPPTLTGITAPRLRLWRGVALAAGLHVAVLGTAMWVLRVHLPPPPPEGPVVAVVMESPPQGDTLAVVQVPHLAPPALAKVAAPRLPLPPPPAPAATPIATPATLPLPAPPAPPVPAPAKAAPPSLVQGVHAPAPLISAETVKVTQPATPDARNAPPYYPPVARSLGEEGQVNLSVEVLANGEVAHVVVAKSSGYPRLDEAARQSLLSWRFHPAVKDGVPVMSIFTYYVRYQLQ